MLYTIMPETQIFLETSQCTKTHEVYMGEIVEVVKYDNIEQISRLISTDPKQFLNAAFAPGSTLREV